jgi:hypothetical protein
VDDFVVFYTDPVLYDSILTRMREVFIGGFKDLGPLHKFLGIIIERWKEGGLRIHQTSKILEILERLDLDDVGPAPSLVKADTSAKLQPISGLLSEADVVFMTTVPYEETVSSLFYICHVNRWNISHTCPQVVRFMTNPGPEYWATVWHIYGYLKCTVGVDLVIVVKSMEMVFTNDDDIDSSLSHQVPG